MTRKGWLSAALAALIASGLSIGLPCTAQACGGMFSPDATIDQNAERIIFAQGSDGTLSTIIQINYEGQADDFAWVLPLPAAVKASDVEAVEHGDALFRELEMKTTPYFIRPSQCAQASFSLGAGAAPTGGSGTQLLASGLTGPYSFDVLKSDTPTALVDWLRGHGYRITPEMEPMIQPYIDAGMVFLAMRLRPDQGVDAIQPIQVTMRANRPMIPLRIAAVAARPDTRILAWFFADQQAVPVNFEHIHVADDEIRYDVYGGDESRSNYDDLVAARIAAADGRAFLTEFAGRTSDMKFADEQLQSLAQDHPYLTRLRATLSPEQMTVDPMFDYDSSQPDVPIQHDLSAVRAVADDCQSQQNVHWVTLLLTLCLPPVLLCGLIVAAFAGVVALIRRRQKKTAGALDSMSGDPRTAS